MLALLGRLELLRVKRLRLSVRLGGVTALRHPFGEIEE